MQQQDVLKRRILHKFVLQIYAYISFIKIQKVKSGITSEKVTN